MNKKSFEQLAYEFNEIWHDDWFGPEDHARITELAKLIPRLARTLLDVGCGNGVFLNHLRRERGQDFSLLIGLDRSEAALQHVRTDKLLSNVDRLPFPDRRFDAVTCMEVLEHLPVSIYPEAISEIARVAKDFILICVPYNENFKANMVKCPSCFTNFNPDFHMRSFSEQKLIDLFKDHAFKLAKLFYLGDQFVRYDQEFRANLRGILRKKQCPAWVSYAICPVCGFSDPAQLAEDLAGRRLARANLDEEQVVQSAVSGLRRYVASKMPRRTEYRWIAATYNRDFHREDC